MTTVRKDSPPDERKWPEITLATVLDSREDLLVEYAATKGVAIDWLRAHLKTQPPQTRLCNLANPVLSQTEDPYGSYIEWLNRVARKLRINSAPLATTRSTIGKLEERLALFRPNKIVGNIEGTASHRAYYIDGSKMRKGRDPWREVRVGTVRSVLNRVTLLVNSVQRRFGPRLRDEVLKYVENRILLGHRGGREYIPTEVLIQPTACVVGVAMSTSVESVRTREREWPNKENSSEAPEDVWRRQDRSVRQPELVPFAKAYHSWHDIIESIVATVKHRQGLGIPVLIALNAPLGWPALMTEALLTHEAGASLPSMQTETSRNVDTGKELSHGYLEKDDERKWRNERNCFFRRETEQVVRERSSGGPFGPNGLDVGASNSGRTAHQALRLLTAIRERTELEIPVITDECGPITRTSAIEVYTFLRRTPAEDPNEDKAHVHPAAYGAEMAAEEAVAFLEHRVVRREGHVSIEQARKEGWIWFSHK